MDPDLPQQPSQNLNKPISQNPDQFTQQIPQEQTQHQNGSSRKISRQNLLIIIFLVLLCMLIPPFQIFLIFFPLWIINRLIVNRSWYTKSKFDTLFKFIIFLIFIGTHFLVLYLLATDPCELKGTCVETFMAGGPLLFITLVTGAILLTLILPFIIILPAKLEPTKLKTILKSPRYIAFIILIIIMIYGNISIAYGFRQGNEEAIEKYQKEQEQGRIDAINYKNEHPEIDRNEQRREDLTTISNIIIKFKAEYKKLPENLDVLKSSGQEIPRDPLTREKYKYFMNNSNGGYFMVCAWMEDYKADPELLCKKNGKSSVGRSSNESDAALQYVVDKEVDPNATYPTPTINPQIIKNDNKRKEDTLIILNAIYKYKDDNQGKLPEQIPPYVDEYRKATEIASDKADLCKVLVPKYLSAFPQDPSINNGKDITSCSNYDSGYKVILGGSGKVFISSDHSEKPYTYIVNFR